ncbi:helix-turn-helix domain-containing protein [Mesorhizobium sp. CN5-321]|uniref:helix-turn-helix domain-containing protein n=1 Tax=Mesorhizobium hunchu TaxID=3157708 RepID=UPI0032B73EBE
MAKGHGIQTVIQTMRRAQAKSGSTHLTEPEAADFLGISVVTLRRIRKRGEIGFMTVANRARYSSVDLHAYLESKSFKPCPKNDLKSGDTISPGIQTLPSTKPDGSTLKLDKHAALLLAQKTFMKQKKPLPSSS